jgi:hypothetical protein
VALPGTCPVWEVNLYSTSPGYRTRVLRERIPAQLNWSQHWLNHRLICMLRSERLLGPMVFLPSLVPRTNDEFFKEGSEEAQIAALEKELEAKVPQVCVDMRSGLL